MIETRALCRIVRHDKSRTSGRSRRKLLGSTSAFAACKARSFLLDLIVFDECAPSFDPFNGTF